MGTLSAQRRVTCSGCAEREERVEAAADLARGCCYRRCGDEQAERGEERAEAAADLACGCCRRRCGDEQAERGEERAATGGEKAAVAHIQLGDGWRVQEIGCSSLRGEAVN